MEKNIEREERFHLLRLYGEMGHPLTFASEAKLREYVVLREGLCDLNKNDFDKFKTYTGRVGDRPVHEMILDIRFKDNTNPRKVANMAAIIKSDFDLRCVAEVYLNVL